MRKHFAHPSRHGLKKNELKPHLKKTWCVGQITGQFIAQMERLLWLYALPYDPHYPVICFDERPCFLIGEVVDALALQAGRVAKEHYAYTKHGSCALLGAMEPLTGTRIAAVYRQRTKKEYAQFMKELAARYPDARQIRVVQDNLNTHNASSFYENFPAAEAFELAHRFAFYYTPRSASWLNMIEFSALARQCLKRRIPTQEALAKEVLAIVKERSDKRTKINWQFSIESARTKFNRHYHQVNADNPRRLET